MAFVHAYPTRRRSAAKLARLVGGFVALCWLLIQMVRLLEEGDRLHEGRYGAEISAELEVPPVACATQCRFNGLCTADGACSCDAGFAGEDCGEAAACLCRPGEPPLPLPRFLERFACDRDAEAHEAQIEADLGPWSVANVSEALTDRADELGDGRFQIYQNRLYLRNRRETPRLRAITTMLLTLLRRVRMPDVDFVVWTGDLPIVPIQAPVPVFSPVKSDAHADILIPDGKAFTEEWPAMVGEVESEPAWAEKRSRLVWRGSPPGGWTGVEAAAKSPEGEHAPRAILMKIVDRQLDDFDVAFASLEPVDAAAEKAVATFGPTRPYVPLAEQLRSKLLLSLDGEGVPGSFAAHLASRSLAVRQASPFREWYYRWLKPWEHFAPAAPSLRDLPDLVRWARSSDADAAAGAAGGARFARERLRQQDALAYLARLLTRYAGTLRYPPRPASGAALVPQPTAGCPCAKEAKEGGKEEVVRLVPSGRVRGFVVRAGAGAVERSRGPGAVPTRHVPAELAQREDAGEDAGLFRVHPPFRHVKGGPRRVALESLRARGHFLRALAGAPVLSPLSRDPWFAEEATWALEPAPADGCPACVALRPAPDQGPGLPPPSPLGLRARPEDGTLAVEAGGPPEEYAFALEAAAVRAAAAEGGGRDPPLALA